MNQRACYASNFGLLVMMCVKTPDSAMLLACCQARREASHWTSYGSSRRTKLLSNHNLQALWSGGPAIAGYPCASEGRGRLVYALLCRVLCQIQEPERRRARAQEEARHRHEMMKKEGSPYLWQAAVTPTGHAREQSDNQEQPLQYHRHQG
jgi:hypothetical protein